MPKPQKDDLRPEQLEDMHIWRKEFGQSVRQNKVRNLSTKDKPGTLPLNMYIRPKVKVSEINFDTLTSSSTPTEKNVSCKDYIFAENTVVYCNAPESNIILYQLMEHLCEKGTARCRKFVQTIVDQTLFILSDDERCDLTADQVVGYVQVEHFDLNEDSIKLKECDMLTQILNTQRCLGEQHLLEGLEEEIEDMSETEPPITSRSGRRHKPNINPEFCYD